MGIGELLCAIDLYLVIQFPAAQRQAVREKTRNRMFNFHKSFGVIEEMFLLISGGHNTLLIYCHIKTHFIVFAMYS